MDLVVTKPVRQSSFILAFGWMIFSSRINILQSFKVAFRCLVKVKLIQKIIIVFVINRFHYLYTFVIPGLISK